MVICQASNCKAHPDWRIIVTTEGFQVYYLCSKHMDNRVYPSGETVNTFTLVAVRLRVSQFVSSGAAPLRGAANDEAN